MGPAAHPGTPRQSRGSSCSPRGVPCCNHGSSIPWHPHAVTPFVSLLVCSASRFPGGEGSRGELCSGAQGDVPACPGGGFGGDVGKGRGLQRVGSFVPAGKHPRVALRVGCVCSSAHISCWPCLPAALGGDAEPFLCSNTPVLPLLSVVTPDLLLNS